MCHRVPGCARARPTTGPPRQAFPWRLLPARRLLFCAAGAWHLLACGRAHDEDPAALNNAEARATSEFGGAGPRREFHAARELLPGGASAGAAALMTDERTVDGRNDHCGQYGRWLPHG
jgi:hypothetical protein